MASPAISSVVQSVELEEWADDRVGSVVQADPVGRAGRPGAPPWPAARVPASTHEDRLLRLAASVGPLRRVLSAIAARLIATKAYEGLGYARLADYARERAGLSARQLQDLARVSRALADLPALERALLANVLPWSKVRLLARVATPEDEAEWIARARAQPTRRLEQAVREHARAPDPDAPMGAEPTLEVRLRCTPAVREKWSRVRELSQRVAGERLAAEDTLEWVVAEVASALPVDLERFAGWEGAIGRGVGASPESEPDWGAPYRSGKGPARRADARALPPDVVALAAGLDDADPFELDRRLRRAVHLEQTLDAAMAPLMRHVTCVEYEWSHDWCRLGTLAREHLGMSATKARILLRLERAGDACPELRRAYRSGRISWAKARVLLPLLLLDIDGAWRPAWVAWAERVTVRRLEQDVERALLLRGGHRQAWYRCQFDPARAQDPIPEDERHMGAPEVDVDATEELVFRVPLGGAALFRAVRARLPFDAMLDHALATWLARDPRARPPDPVIVRDGYRCAVPGCMSRRNLQDHHIDFRSHGGSDALGNRITLCAFHHHRGVHAGFLRICGSAPDGLVFELGVRAGAPPLARYRSGDVSAPEVVGGLALLGWMRRRPRGRARN